MTPGKLRKAFGKDVREATVGPDGWESNDRPFAAYLDSAYPVGGTAAGVGWVQAFWAAVDGLGAEAVVEPIPDASPPGTIH